jgi:ABC-type uncharacterized transport system permease subunit
MSGISIICFAASYAVAFLLELTRLLFRSGLRGAVMIGFAAAGLLAHTLYLYYRAVSTVGSPLSSKQDWYLVAAWVLAAVYLYLTAYYRKTAFGVFLLPLVLGLIGVGTFLADPKPFPRQPASEVWGMIHGIALLLASVSVIVGFMAGLMYLWQERRLKHKLPPPRGLRLPSLEWLQRANSHAILVSSLLLGVGILGGLVLNRIQLDPGVSRVPWYDPFVLSTLGMFLWLAIASGIVIFYRPARVGRKVAYLTLVSFIFLLVALAVGLSGRTQHGGRVAVVSGQWSVVSMSMPQPSSLPDHRPLATDHCFLTTDHRPQTTACPEDLS